jgi:CubicO group peptidase (beta-lactamase class C family)
MRFTTTCRFLFASLCVAAAGAAAASGALAAPADPAALRAALTQAMHDNGIPGASYALFDRNGIVLSDTIGLANAKTGVHTTPATLFRIGSISKSVTAIAIMQLVEQGRFTLQTPVAQLLPKAPIDNPYAQQAPVRIVHLLTHTAGLDDTHPTAFFSATERRGGHLDALISHPESLQLRWRPGASQSYSNTGYVLLGAILEAHYRQPWDEIVARQVLQPLGMRHTVALASVAMAGDHAFAHAGKDMRLMPMPFDLTQAQGALWSNAEDLARLGRFFLTDGASAPGLLTPATVAAMKRAQGGPGAVAGLDYGNALGQRGRIVDSIRWQGHSGGVMGAVASMHYHAPSGTGYVLMLNSEETLRKAELPLVRYLDAKYHLAAAAPVTVPVAAGAEGWFRTVNPRISLLALPTYLLSSGHASVQGSEVTITPPAPGMGMEAKLHHLGKDLLADVDDGGKVANGVLLRDASGQVARIELDGVMLERSSMLGVVMPLASVLLSVLMLVTVPFGRRRALQNRWTRRLPALALLTLIAAAVCAANLQLHLLADVSWQTVGIFLCTALFPLLAVLGLASSVRGWRKETATLAKFRCLLGSLGAVVLAGWLAAFHLAGFALWAW